MKMNLVLKYEFKWTERENKAISKYPYYVLYCGNVPLATIVYETSNGKGSPDRYIIQFEIGSILKPNCMWYLALRNAKEAAEVATYEWLSRLDVRILPEKNDE